MKIGNEYPSCRYWGYEPLSRDKFSSAQGAGRRRAAKEKLDADVAAIKASGNKPYVSGCTHKEAAITTAALIEKISGVEMHVYNHDYL